MEGGEVNASTPVVEEALPNVRAESTGRGKFGGRTWPWDGDRWPVSWGEEPPFDRLVFVLTQHAREPLNLSATTFTFVTDGSESALDQAQYRVVK